MTYTPPTVMFKKGVVSLKDKEQVRVCSLRVEPTTYTMKSKRILSNMSSHTREYMREYPKNQGRYRLFKLVPNPQTTSNQDQIKNLRNILKTDGWDPEHEGTTDTLIMEPFTYIIPPSKGVRGSSRQTNLTQHTEIVIKAGGDLRFFPVSWHRGDQRTMFRYHHPTDCGMRVL